LKSAKNDFSGNFTEMLLGYPDHAWVPQKRAKNDFSYNFSGNAPRMA
ncbi:hypothetical protein T11_10436, partial [Trichinella zimbabwensis]